MRSARNLHFLARAASVRSPLLSSVRISSAAASRCTSCCNSAAASQLSTLPIAAFSTAATATTTQIKQLRERTGAPITECRDALQAVIAEGKTDVGSDAALMDAAVEFLRKKGISTAAKKSGRAASEGLVGLEVRGNAGALIEVNSETDFAARNNLFRQLCATISATAAQIASNASSSSVAPLTLQSLQSTNCSDPTAASAQHPVQSVVTNVVASLRENIQLRRAEGLSVTNGVLGSYMHNAVVADELSAAGVARDSLKLGRQGSLIALETSSPVSGEAKEKLQTLANKLAMQVVAATPKFVSRADVSADAIAQERAVLTEQANAPPIHVPGQMPKKTSSKPKDPKQIEKMVEGRINKWMGEIVLLEQPLLVSGDWDASKPPTVAAILESTGKAINTTVKIAGMSRFLVGEGVVNNKSADDFAKEVADKIAKAKQA